MTACLRVQAAQQHPYVVKPSAGRVGSWVACGALGGIIGCCAINPDGGDYGVWLQQVRADTQSGLNGRARAHAVCGRQQRRLRSRWHASVPRVHELEAKQ